MIPLNTQEFAIVPAPTTDWAALTCSNAVTLRLADTLNKAQYEAWAPKISTVKRVGPARDRKPTPEAVMPGFVFVPFSDVWLLSQMTYSPAQQFQIWDEDKQRMVAMACPPFRIMRHEHNREPVRISDRGLDALRMHERARRPIEEIRLFDLYERVRYPAAGFEGLTGVVVWSKPKVTRVTFPGNMPPVELPTALLISMA